MGVVFALQGRRQLALPSTYLIAAAWMAASPAHFGPWHVALPRGGRAGLGQRGWGPAQRSSPTGLGPRPHPQPLSRVSAVPAAAGAGLPSINRRHGRRVGEEVRLGQGENAGERPGETGWGCGEGRGENRGEAGCRAG